MTRKPSRLRRWMKWARLMGCGVVVGACVFRVHFAYSFGDGHWELSTWSGNICLNYFMSLEPSRQVFNAVFSRTGVLSSVWIPTVDTAGGNWSLVVPTCIPLAIIAIPTAIFWYSDRKPPRGHCQACCYNLIGNVSGVCPECGTGVKQP